VPKLCPDPLLKASKPFFNLQWRGRRQMEAKLKAPPDSSIQELWMVRGNDND